MHRLVVAISERATLCVPIASEMVPGSFWALLQGTYHGWADKSGFISMLPADARDCKSKAATSQLPQGRLDSHLQDIPPPERIVPYSDRLFREAAIEWLIATDQVGLFCTTMLSCADYSVKIQAHPSP
jgi:hypothetical protein